MFAVASNIRVASRPLVARGRGVYLRDGCTLGRCILMPASLAPSSEAPRSFPVRASVLRAPTFWFLRSTTSLGTDTAPVAPCTHERCNENRGAAWMSTLPLLTRVKEDGVTFALTRRRGKLLPIVTGADAPVAPSVARVDGALRLLTRPTQEESMPQRAPGAGEQYRVHGDMGKCIGCKCCVVACNEQNGNPASINWRRVQEIEGGWFPMTSRSFLSMGCNHCLEPTCLHGCPVDAYSKDPVTGIVRHSADTCIGCQYCTWNCSYGVPQYTPERGVVGKCDMCHGRLSHGETPACVSACPEGAIAIEIVNVAAWQSSIAARRSNAGLPPGDHSLSTTRVTLPEELPPHAA